MSTEPPALPAPPPPGAYRFTDHSVLRPWVTQVWFERLFRLLPPWIGANVITLISTGTLVAVILGSVFATQLGPLWFGLLTFVALQLYVAGDHLDGMQARATGTKSPLGDFLDHHCDLWAGCVLCFGYWSLTATAPLWEVYGMNAVLMTAFAITFVERAERKTLHFTAWGTLEAIAILSVFYLSWCVPAARAWWNRDLFTGLPRHMLIGALGTAMALGAIVIIARRLQRLPAPLILNIGTVAALAAWCLNSGVPPLWGWFAVTLAGADYVALVMQAHTTARPRPWPDLVATLGVAALWLLPNAGDTPALLFIALTGWLVIRYVLTITRILSGWRQHWVWVNSRAGTAP